MGITIQCISHKKDCEIKSVEVSVNEHYASKEVVREIEDEDLRECVDMHLLADASLRYLLSTVVGEILTGDKVSKRDVRYRNKNCLCDGAKPCRVSGISNFVIKWNFIPTRMRGRQHGGARCGFLRSLDQFGDREDVDGGEGVHCVG